MKRSKNTMALLREHHLLREKEAMRRQAQNASSHAKHMAAVARKAKQEAHEAMLQRDLIRATKWFCNESNSDRIAVSICVPRDRWLRVEEAQMVMAHGLEQIGCNIGVKIHQMVMKAVESGMKRPSVIALRAKRNWLMNLRPEQYGHIGFEEASRMYDACMESLKQELANTKPQAPK